MDLSPATIRNAMAELDEEGYLEQPHTSGGRIPTDKAYRYFVDNLFPIHTPGVCMDSVTTPGVSMAMEIDQEIVRKMAKRLKMFVAVFDGEKDIISAGIDEIFGEPEFKNYEVAKAFAEILENFENVVETYAQSAQARPRAYIGKEHPFRYGTPFGSVFLKDEENDCVMISFGPKRMNYEKIIAIMSKIYD